MSTLRLSFACFQTTFVMRSSAKHILLNGWLNFTWADRLVKCFAGTIMLLKFIIYSVTGHRMAKSIQVQRSPDKAALLFFLLIDIWPGDDRLANTSLLTLAFGLRASKRPKNSTNILSLPYPIKATCSVRVQARDSSPAWPDQLIRSRQSLASGHHQTNWGNHAYGLRAAVSSEGLNGLWNFSIVLFLPASAQLKACKLMLTLIKS